MTGRTDSKSKWVKTLIVWLCCLDYLVYFVKISIRDALPQLNDDTCKVNVSRILECTQGIRRMKTFTMHKKCCYWKYHKKTQEAMSNVEITVIKSNQLVKSKVPSSINYPYFAKIFNFVVVKNCRENYCWENQVTFCFWAGVTNITLVLRFM